MSQTNVRRGTRLHRLHILSLYSLVSGGIYLFWLFFNIEGIIGMLFFFLECAMFLLVVLFSINHWHRRYGVMGGVYSLGQNVDIFITIKNEPPTLLEETLKAAAVIIHPNKKIFVLDDGARASIKLLARLYGATYFVRPDRYIKQYKAANLNYAFKHSTGAFILVLDVDQISRPMILNDLLGHFNDESVALVSTRQSFFVDRDDFNNDHLFYDYMQAGKSADGVGISCGSGVIYRRKALEEIGGFQEWNIVEDLYTSYVLNSKGYATLYVNQAYTKGIAPTDLRTIYKQRGTWAHDSLRLLFWRMPLLNLNMPMRKRLHYFELGYIYLVSAIILPFFYFLTLFSLYQNEPILRAGFPFLALKGISFYFILKMYNELGQGASSSRMWAALFPVYLKATILALFYIKPSYIVTKKITSTVEQYTDWHLILPHIILIGIGIITLDYHIRYYGFTVTFAVNFFWLLLMTYWLVPVIPKIIPSQNALIRK